MNLPEKKYRQVAVCVDASRNYGRGVLQGVAEYIETHAPWSLVIDPQAAGYSDQWLKDWGGQGILIQIENPVVAQHIRRAKIPAVEVSAHRLDLGLVQVGNDDRAIGQLAAKHLLERKFKHFAFAGYPNEPWSDIRGEGFAETVRAAGFAHEPFLSAHRPGTLAEGEQIHEQLVEWITRLPKPVALMACSDRHAQRILEACRRAKICVPEEMAVIGVNNDEELCRLSNPPLTSVICNPQKVGREAARLLDELMSSSRRARQVEPVLIPPLGIATRRSTDVMALEDKLIAAAVHFIRERAFEELRVEQLPAQFHVSRAAFFHRFQQAMGRSPRQEILRVRLNRARDLLTQTDLPVEKIAELSGFRHPEYLGAVFRRESGQTPGQYRRKHQPK